MTAPAATEVSPAAARQLRGHPPSAAPRIVVCVVVLIVTLSI